MKLFISIYFLFVIMIHCQAPNKIVIDDKSGKAMLLGICDRSAFADTSFSWWFNSEYDNYTVDSLLVQRFSQKIDKAYTVQIIMGTWCSDSRREVPRFFKILDRIHYPQSSLLILCVDRDKKTLEGLGEILETDIKLVPTFILLKDSKEVGRITETPIESLEKDLFKMVDR